MEKPSFYAMKTRATLIIISLLCLFDCFADNSQGKDSYIFSKIDYQQGLSNSAVISVFQDKEGLMWFGTYDGVNCYDGKEMDVYRSDFSTDLTNNVIYRIQQADSSCLWISTGAGLNRFSPILRKVVSNYEITGDYCLHSNHEGNTWVLGYDWMSYYNTRYNRFVKVERPEMLVDNLVTRAFVTDDGKLWVFPIASTGEMYQFSLDSFEQDTLSTKVHLFTSTFHSKPIDYIYYQNDVFCFIDADKDLYMYDISRKSKIYIRNIASLVQKYGDIKGIVPFYEDIIIAFWTNGLIRLRTSHKYEEEIVDQNVRIFDVYKDSKQGILWVGADGQGAIMYAKKYSIANHLMLNSLSPNLSRQVRSLMTDKYGGLWFGTKGDGLLHIPDYRNGMDASKAVVHFPEFKQEVSTYKKGHKEFQVYTLQQSRFMDGFWVGAGANGLLYYSFKDDRLHQIVDTLENRSSEIHAIHEVNDSTLYLATSGAGFRKLLLDRSGGGIRVKEQKRYHFYYEQRDIAVFFSMLSEGDSILWLGSREKGIIRFDTKTEEYQVISLKSLLNKAVDDVLCMYRFSDEQLYVGTTSGLVSLTFKGNKINAEYVGREQGLLNDMIHGILKDANDFLWLGTNKGLIKFNPVNHSSHAYYYTGGVQIGEFSDDAYYECPYTGNLFFGGIDGLLYMNQEVATAPEYYPDILLRKLYIGRHEVNLADYLTEDGKGLQLKSSDVSFSLKYIVPDYITGADVEYSYMLEGYDKEWTPFSGTTEASYTQVPVGDYLFNIRYKKDVFDTEYKHFTLPVHIAPLWYQTIWARIIYALLAILVIVYVAYLLRKYFRSVKMMKKMQETEQKNASLEVAVESFQSRDLINAFTTIYQMCDQLRSENTSYEQRCRKIELIRETVMTLLFSSDALSKEEVSQLSPVNFTISGRMCLKEMSEEVLQLFDRRGEDITRVTIEIPESFSFEVYKNAIRCFFYYIYSFVFAHKDAAGITVHAVEQEGKLQLVVTSADGLVNDLYQVLSGKLSVGSIKQIDDAFLMGVLQHFVQSALDQMCDASSYEEVEGIQRLSFVFSPVREQEQAVGKKTVLLLEDRDEMVWLITSLLSSEYIVHQVKTVHSAFEYIKQTPPSLFLVDMLMYADAEGTFMEYINKNRPLLAKTAFIPMLTWKASSSIQQELIKWSDSYIVLPYDILFLNKVIYKAIYGKQEAKQIYVEELGDFSEQIVCCTNEQVDFIKKLLHVLERNLDKEDLGSTFLAEQMAMSPRQFYRKFKEISGMAPSDLIKNYRMEKAARLLLNDELSIQDVISDVGIASRSYFYKEFTRKYGMTPKDYREAHKK